MTADILIIAACILCSILVAGWADDRIREDAYDD